MDLLTVAMVGGAAAAVGLFIVSTCPKKLANANHFV